MLLTTTLTDDFTLAVPRVVLDATGCQPGQLFLFDVLGRNVTIKMTTPEELEALKATDLEIEAEVAALEAGCEPECRDDLFGMMDGRQVEEFVRDRSDRY